MADKRYLELLICEVFPKFLGNSPQVGERDLARLIIVKEFECLIRQVLTLCNFILLKLLTAHSLDVCI